MSISCHPSDGNTDAIRNQLLIDDDAMPWMLAANVSNATENIGYANLNPDKWFVPFRR